jgi:DNA replication protein DnaC
MQTVELRRLLGALRLNGMADALDVRTREALETNLSPTEYLGLLLSDEMARREQARYATRLRRANLDGQATFVTYDHGLNPDQDQRVIRELATCRFIGDTSPVLIMGPVGTGKSHVAQALGHEAVRQGFDVLFTGHAELLAQLGAAQADGTYGRKLAKLTRIDLLIIDDFALRPMTIPQEEHFHDVIAARYRRASTVLTSNLYETEFAGTFQNRLLGAAAIDRLLHGAYRVKLGGRSRRVPRPMDILPHEEGAGKGAAQGGPDPAAGA